MLTEPRKFLRWYLFAGRDILRPSGTNVYLQCEADTRIWTHVKVPFTSYVVDLEAEDAERFGAYLPKLRQNIRAALRLSLTITRGQDYAPFLDIYQATLDARQLSAVTAGHLATKPGLLISYIHHPEHGILAAHANLLDTQRGIVKLEYNASNYRAFPPKSGIRNQCGQANALLFHADFEFFAAQGFRQYDFGGYDEDDGVTDFKKQFNGKIVQQYNYFPTWYYLYRKLANR